MKTKFLLCLDGMGSSKTIAKIAARTAHSHGAELHLFTVIDIEQTREMIYENIIETYKASIQEALEEINDIIYKSFNDLIIRTTIKEGLIIECISDFIKENSDSFKIVFLGACGSKHIMLNRITNTVLKNSNATIIIIPETPPANIIQKGIL